MHDPRAREIYQVPESRAPTIYIHGGRPPPILALGSYKNVLLKYYAVCHVDLNPSQTNFLELSARYPVEI